MILMGIIPAMKSSARIVTISVVLCACPDASTTSATDVSSTGTQGTVDGGSTDTMVTAPTGSSTGVDVTTTSETGTDTAAVSCGNGAIDDVEACDDGNLVNGDGCNKDCTVSAALVWEYRSGLKGDDSFRGVASTVDGKIFAVGARFVEGNQARWVTQFQDHDQAPVWAETYDNGQFEGALAVGVQGSAIYVAGAASPSGDKDAWVGQLDLDGKIIWEEVVDSGFGDDFVTNLSVSPEGGVVVAGVISLDGGLAATWTRRYGASGDVQWTHEVAINAAALYTVGPGVVVTAEQVVVGAYRSPEPDAYQAVLFAYPPSGGEPSWMVDLPTKGGVFGVASDPGGDVALVLQDVPLKFVVHRASSMGKVLWSSTQCSGEIGSAVAIDSQGDIVAIGGGPGATGMNIRLCKFSAEGELRWGKDLDSGLGDDRGLSVAILPDDRIVASGHMWGGEEERTDAWLAVFTP